MVTNQAFHTRTALAQGLRGLFKQFEERLSLSSPVNVYLAGGIAVHLYTASRVTTTYKVNNLANWAKKPEVQAAFPVVKSILDGAGSKESKHAIKFTSQGWEAKGLD